MERLVVQKRVYQKAPPSEEGHQFKRSTTTTKKIRQVQSLCCETLGKKAHKGRTAW